MGVYSKKNYKLSIYLIKKEITDFTSAIKGITDIQEFNFNENIQVEGKIIIGKTKTSQPDWRNLLQEGVNTQLPSLENTSNRAIAFFKIKRRIFAIPFGYGKHLLKEDVIERDFGLKTALNIVDADKLLSIDKANFGDLTVHTRTQASKKGSPTSFDIDVIKDLLRSITGEPSLALPEEFGSIITGNEGVYISPKTNIIKIPDILKKLNDEYGKDTYKKRFDWIDNIKSEKDPNVIDALRQNLVKDLKAKNSEIISLAPPYILDWENFEGITFTPKGNIYNEFNIEDFYNEKDEKLGDLTWDKLYTSKLYIRNSNYKESHGSALWRFLTYETEYNGFRYVFTLSNWYKVDKTYFDELYNYCKGYEESSLTFIDAVNESEGEYNDRLAKSNSAFILMDQNLVKSLTTRSEIEACDVFTKSKEFIHIKKRYSSATLSHLFSQGRVSGYSLIRDKTFRTNLRNKIAALGLPKDLIPSDSKKIKGSDYTITFAIIEEKKRSFVDSLPFFSLINFRLIAAELSAMGFDVRVKKIEKK